MITRDENTEPESMVHHCALVQQAGNWTILRREVRGPVAIGLDMDYPANGSGQKIFEIEWSQHRNGWMASMREEFSGYVRSVPIDRLALYK